MTLLLYRDGFTNEVKRSEVLPGNRRRRLSAIVARRLDPSRAQVTSRHRIPEHQLAVTDETVVLRSERRHCLVGPKDIVVITTFTMGGGGAGGGGGSGKQIGMAVASIALMIAAPYAISFLGPAFAATAGVTSSLTLLGRALSTGLIIGGVALMSMANKAKANKSNEDTRPVYGVSGGGNLPRPGDRIPVGYGRFWTLPDLSQPDYFIYSGEDQILYKRMTLGAGRYQIHSVRVGDQLLWTEGGGYHAPFTGAQVEFIQPGTVSDLVPLDVTSSSAVSGLALPQVGDASAWSGPFVVSPPGVNVNYIQFDVSLPSGSYGTASNSKGTHDVPTETGYEFQIAPIDFAGNPTGPWVTVIAAERFLMSKRPLRYTERVNVALGRYAARGRNTKARFNTSADTRMNAVQWDGLRGWRPDVRTRPGITEVALMVRSNESLGITTFQDVMIEATRIIPVWNGVAWVEQATRKSVWAFADVMRNGVYGGNILDSALDLATLEYYASAAAPFDTFDGVMRGPDSIWGVASTILATMRAEPVQLGRVWSMVRDEPKSIRRHVITRRQIVQGSTSIEFDTDPDDGAGHVIVDYDEGADPKRPVQPPDFIYGQASLTPQRRKLFGVSSYAHAVHLGRWIAASGFFRRQTYKFSVEHEGRIYKRGDSISVEAWFASKAKVAGIVGRSGTTLTVDTDIAVDAGDQIILRDRTGRQWGPVALTGQGNNLRELVLAAVTSGGIPIADALATDEMEPTTVIVGQPTVLTRNYLVKSARPSGRDRIAVEAQIDSTAVWDAIGAAIGSPPSPEAGPQTPVVPQLFYVNGEMAQGVAEPMVKWSVSPARGATGYQVEISYDDGESWSSIYSGADTSGIAPLSAALFNDDDGPPIVLIRARAVGRTGLWSPYINSSFGARSASIDGRALQLNTVQIEALVDDLQDKLVGAADVEGSIAQARARADAVFADLTKAGGAIDQARASAVSDIANLRDALVGVMNRFEQHRAATIEAGLEINSAEGKARIYGLTVLREDMVTRFNSVAIEINALAAEIALIAETVIEGDLTGLVQSITQAGVRINALEGLVSTFVTTATFSAGMDRVTSAETRLDGAEAAIAQRVTNATFGEAETRLTTAEQEINALTGEISRLIVATSADSVNFDLRTETLGQLLDLVSRLGQASVESLAIARDRLSSRIDDNGRSIAESELLLAATRQEAAANLLLTQQAIAAGDAAEANQRLVLTAQVNNPTTGLTKTAQRVDLIETSITADGVVGKRVSDIQATAGDAFARVGSIETVLINGGGLIAGQQSQVVARANGATANGSVTMAFEGTAFGFSAAYSWRLTANGADIGMFAVIKPDGNNAIWFKAGQFLIGGSASDARAPFAVIGGVTYIDRALIRTGDVSRHASNVSGGSSVTAYVGVQPDGRVNVIVVYHGGQILVNGGAAYLYLYRNGALIDTIVISSTYAPASGGSGVTSYTNTVGLASYDTTYEGTDTITAVLSPAYGLSTLQLVGLSIQATSYLK